MPSKSSGIFTTTTKIVDVVARYNVKEDWQTREDDISLELTLDIGKSFQPTTVIGGYFNRNDDGSIKNYGTATKVKILLESAGLDWRESVDDNHQLTDDALEQLQGKEICMLSYIYGTKPNGKTGWTYWNEVAKAGFDEALRRKFHTAVENEWVKNYRPDDTDSFDPKKIEESKSEGYQL